MAEKPTYEELEQRVSELEKENSGFKRMGDALKNRIAALTLPLKDDGDIAFADLFDLDDIQRIQDEFARVAGVASIITHTDGTPITAPSNFRRLCRDIIRNTDKGQANCFKSDALIGRFHPEGPIIQPCMSGGLWDAGAGITVGGRHIANWLIGQVRDELQTEDKMRAYAREIGADEDGVIAAFREVPAMSREKFGQIAGFLFTLASQLSMAAYQNVQQARFISERRRSRAALVESENRYQSIVEHIPQKIFTKDLNAVYLSCNRSYADDLGMAPEEIFGKDDFMFYSREQAEKYRADDKRIMAAGKMETIEEKYLVQGKEQWVKTTKVPLKRNDEVYGILGIFEDVTEQKQAEKALMESEGKLRAAFDATPFPIAVSDLKADKILFWSRSALTLFGHTAATVSEWYQKAYPDPDYRQEVITRWTPFQVKARDAGRFVNTGEYRVTCSDGSVRICEIYATFLPDMLIVTFNDITDRVEARKALKKQHENLEYTVRKRTADLERTLRFLESSNKELESFAYIASHDLQEPLRKVQAFSDRLKTKYAKVLDAQGMDYLTRLESSGRRMQAMVNDLLAFSRIKTRGSAFIPINLHEIIKDAIADLEIRIKETNACIEINDLQLVEADPQQMRQLFLNLISNAIKFHAKDVSPSIKIFQKENAAIASGSNAFCDIVVQDNGIGFEEQYLDRIFKPFQRLHGRESYEGTGIGLAICHRIVERHGGQITAESRVGHGTRFIITLPMIQNSKEKTDENR